jgi:integrase/recombinase XerD
MEETLLTEFYAYLLTQKRVAHNTFLSYQYDLKQYMEFIFKDNIPLSATNNQVIKKFLASLHAMGVSARSRARKLSCLKSFYAWASRTHQWPNHALDIPFPHLEKKIPFVLSEEDIGMILHQASLDTSDAGKRNAMMLYLMYATGMRVTELISIKISHIQFDSQFMCITGKGGKDRIIPLPENIMHMLKLYIEDFLVALYGRYKQKDIDYLFPVFYAHAFKPMSRQMFWMIIKDLCKKSGIQHAISPHHIRHAIATHLLKKGVDLRSLQVLLGHESIGTVQVYTHVEVTHLRKMYDKKHPRA